MKIEKKAISNLDYLKRKGVLEESATLEDAVHIFTDPLNCAECIASGQCAECYGFDANENADHDCMEVVMAFLKQDHKKDPNSNYEETMATLISENKEAKQ